MESNTCPSRPDWLTDEVIAKLKNDIAICPSPYTQKEVDELEFDTPFDFKSITHLWQLKTLRLLQGMLL